MPDLRRTDFGDVPASRAVNRVVVCGGISGIRNYASDGKVAVFYRSDHRSDDYGFAGAAVAGSSDLAGIRGGIVAFRLCATKRRLWAVVELAIAAPTFATQCGRACWWDPRRGFWEFFAVGIGRWLQIGAQARRHGLGRREDDGHGGRVCGIARNVLDHFVGKPARQRNWIERGSGVVPKRLAARSGGTWQPERAGNCKRLAVEDCKPIPVAAGNVLGNWGTGDCLPWAVNWRTVARTSRNLAVNGFHARMRDGKLEEGAR